MFSSKDSVTNFYVPSPLTPSVSDNFKLNNSEECEAASLPPYPFNDNLETLAEASSIPNSPQRTNNCDDTFVYQSSEDVKVSTISYDKYVCF